MNKFDREVFLQMMNARLEMREREQEEALHSVKQEIIALYAEHFTKGDTKKAHKILEHNHSRVRVKDAVVLSIAGGFAIAFTINLIAFLIIPSNSDDWDDQLHHSLASFRAALNQGFYGVEEEEAEGAPKPKHRRSFKH